MREVKGGFANFVFRTVFTALRAFLKSGFCAAQLCIRSGIVSWMPLNSSLSNIPSYSCSLIRRPPLVLPCAGQVNNGWTGKFFFFFGFGPGQVGSVLEF